MNRLMKKIIPVLFALLLLIPSTIKAESEDDITGHHHENELRIIIEKGIMKGYGDGIYLPNGNVTRGQFAVIITRALNLEDPGEGVVFSDVTEETGVMGEVTKAAGAGLINGYPDGSFKPTAKISRQHMAVIIQNALDYLNMEDHANNLTFKDKALIIKDYHSAVSNAVYYGIINGSPKADGIYFRPLDNATRGDAAAVINRFLNAVEKADEVPPIDEKPDLTFDTATIQADGSTVVLKTYKTYNEALTALKADQAIKYGESIIKMPSGIVVSKPTLASSLTIIYPTKNLDKLSKATDTYVTSDTELEYISSTDEYVEIKVAGKRGFIKQENSILIPWKAVKNRSYYSSSNGVLTHYIYLNQTGKHVSYVAGKAPSFMVNGENYYSWDGINFFKTSGIKAGEGYQYFQYLPARSETQYTAEEIDAYILTMLKKLESDYPNNATYTNASEKSKLVGLGGFLKEIEESKKINALMILALAQHESTYGLSGHAQNYNNLFGLYVYDDNPLNKNFETVEENITELVNAFWNKNYIPPNAAHANGSVFGNKAMGFNVRYASDSYWGAKAAGHLYRMDKMMGGKDLANPYNIGLTTEPLNVRIAAGTQNAAAYRYLKSGMPVIIVEPAELNPWLKIVSDSTAHDVLFVHGDYVKGITTVK